MTHHIDYIDGETMKRYLRRGHRERSKATWQLLTAASRAFSGTTRRLLGQADMSREIGCHR